MTIRAVIFDRDGVLTHFDVAAATQFFRPLLPISVYALAARWQAAGEQHGFPRSLAEERDFFARFWSQTADEFQLTAAQRARLADVDYTRFVITYPETPLVLAELRRRGLRLGVLSNFSLASLDQSLASAGLAHYFDAICAAQVIGFSKPAAEAYQVALDALQTPANECLYFDDEEENIAAAQRVGMGAYFVDRGAATDDWQRQVVKDLYAALALVSEC